MSVNWVMFAAGTSDFIRLPNEQVLFTTPSRVALSLDSASKFPGQRPYSLACASGKAWLTNRRLIYLPTTQPPSTSNNPSPAVLHSFSAPHTHLHDSHVTAPWFGPNAWTCVVQPVPGGGIPGSAGSSGVELTLTFKEGGAYDFHARICQIRERLMQMRELYGVAQEVDGQGGGAAAAEVHLEQLPAYEAVGQGVPVPQPQPPAAPASAAGAELRGDEPAYTSQAPPQQSQRDQRPAQAPAGSAASAGRAQGQPLPDEPPPGYEEAQSTAVTSGVSVAELDSTSLHRREGA